MSADTTGDVVRDQGREAFRASARAWFRAHREEAEHLVSDLPYAEGQRAWLRLLNTQGFGAPHVAREWGGGGYGLSDQAVVYEEWARSEAPPLTAYTVTLNHVPATLLAFGTEEQQQAYVRQAIDGTIWCQGFSEPGSGSDLASLSTRAVRDGDDYVVTGHKIWSSRAKDSAYCLLLARTEAGSVGGHGISYFVMDMDSPGLDVRPILQNTGQAEFCEVFLDEVRIPARNLIGADGEGWTIAAKTLSTERGPIALETIERINVGLGRLREQLWPDDRGSGELTEAQARLADLIARGVAVRALAHDAIRASEEGEAALGLSSIIKISFSELLRSTTDLGVAVSGEDAFVGPPNDDPLGYISGHWMSDYVLSWAWTIAGGTNEIQRNIVAERVLGMPRERRAS